jgi:hypothetical protein
MRQEDSRDPSLDRRGASMAAWERSLRPSRSTGAVGLLIGVVTAAALLYVVFGLWPNARQMRDAAVRKVAPAAPAPPVIAPAPRQDARRRPEADAPQRTQRFAKCIAAAGAITYSDGPCPAGTRATEVAVNPDLNLADGMSDEARLASMRDNRARAHAVVEHERRVAMNVDGSTSPECAQLKAQIEAIDAAARQPLSAFRQDQLKDERRRAHDRRFALRCG